MLKKYFVIFSLTFSFFLFGQNAYARNAEDVTDWYIQNFETSIVVNKDSSLFITENITADCGTLPNKHGIFRVLPTETKTSTGVIFKTPIELVSITDFNGKLYKYQTINDNWNHTITWKIGDANVTVTGVNYYRITYKVKNAVRFGNKDFDELYWNLLGNFWDIGTDNFSAKISFPPEVNSLNTQVDYYTGELGSKDKSSAIYYWDSEKVLNFFSIANFLPGEGVTVSVTFPKNIFTPYVPGFWEKYGDDFWYLSFLIPLLVFIFAFSKWRKYGKDPKMKTPIPPEFGIPENITPIQMGMVLSTASWKNSFITATIIDLAVRKIIVIEQTEKKVLLLKQKDIVLKKILENYNLDKVTPTEKVLLEKLFGAEDSVKLSILEDNFYQDIPAIKKSAKEDTTKNDWLVLNGNKYSLAFIAAGIILLFLSNLSAIFSSYALFFSLIFSGVILIIFGLAMPKLTQKGVDLLFKIKGFERYMRQAENYRQQFYERENIFDKFLPYAMVFGITNLWIKKMKLIYGEEYFKNYHPAWFVGGMTGSFSVNSFTSQLNSITTGIDHNVGGASGAGGSGGAGGGGGGGGGGGW